MPLATLLLAVSLVAAGQASQSPAVVESDCARALSSGINTAATAVCLGEEQLRLGDAAARESRERRRRFDMAAQQYRRAANLRSATPTRALALNRLADLYDPQHLDQPYEMELVLRELVALLPTELEPLYRLAHLHEDQGLVDAAETTLLSARHLRPDDVEPYRRLAQFYARRSTALSSAQAQEGDTPANSPTERGRPDALGVYRVGQGVEPPRREGRPSYPEAAQAAGIQGVVVAEVVISEAGLVTDARVVRSIPLLDEAALEAVREWRFDPTVVDGRAVPVKMTVTVNFTLPG